MRAFLQRHRHLALLLVVLFAQLLLLAYQIKPQNDVRLIRLWAATLVTPVEKGLHFVVDSARALWEAYIGLYGAERENRQLRAELEQVRLRLHELQARAAEADRLAAMLELKQNYPKVPLLAAEVIGASPAPGARTFFVDHGRNHGVKRNMAVLTPLGIVGKIIHVYPNSAQVLLITDRESGVGAMLAETHVQGVVKGTGQNLCRLEYISKEEAVAVGMRVLTSGQDLLYPKGFPIGTIVSIEPGEYFHEILVEPAAHLDRLEHVFILVGVVDTLALTRAPGPAQD